MTDFCQTWYVGCGGGAQILPTWSVVTECAYLIPHLHICSDWLITKKSNIQSSVWATLMKLGMWIVVGTSTTHVVCHYQMRIFNTSFAYLFSLANNKKGKYPEFVWATVMKLGMWIVMGTSITTWSVITKCAYLIPHLHICSHWLITRKVNMQSFVWATVMKLGMWVVVGTSIAYQICGHRMCISHLHICSDRLIKKATIQRLSSV